MNRIKKQTDNNEYIFSNNLWIRNFTKNNPYKDINKTYKEEDYFIFLQNETKNCLSKYPWIETENFNYEKIIIVSDGYNFLEKQKLLENINKNVCIIGVNNVLNKWNLSKNINFYIVNNPYSECMKYFPRKNKNLPKCIASTKTNWEFLSNYKGNIYKYCPVNEENYKSTISKEVTFQINDYRNPICAAIQLAYNFGVEKLLLFCCDNSFNQKKDGAIKLENELYQYPQHKIAEEIIDANLYWLKSLPYYNIEIKDHSSGSIYKNAEYIKEEEILSFLN